MIMKTIEYSLVLESPLLISSSATFPGVYDRITMLDNGLPYVPASSLRGRVKDTIRWFLLDNRTRWNKFLICKGQEVPVETNTKPVYCPQTNPCPLCRIFGAPGGLKRGFDFSGAYYPDDAVEILKKAFNMKDDERDHVSSCLETQSLTRRARNKYDDDIRRVQEDHLFVDGVAEMVADLTGTIRETTAHLRFGDKIRIFDYRLLLLGLRLTTELGASRNRGYGRCEFLPKEGEDWMTEIEKMISEWKAVQKGKAS